MTPEGKKIWDSPAGASLMEAMLGEKPFTKQDELVLESLRKSNQGGSSFVVLPWKQTNESTAAATRPNLTLKQQERNKEIAEMRVKAEEQYEQLRAKHKLRKSH